MEAFLTKRINVTFVIILILSISWSCKKEQNDKLDLEKSFPLKKESIEVSIGNH